MLMTREEDEALLKAVREWRPPTKLHPIAMHAWGIYEKNNFDLPPAAVAELRAALDSYGDDLIKLAEAIEGVTRFMILLNEHRKDEANGKRVLELLREYAERFQPFWERVAEALQNVGGDSLDAFQKFIGQDEKGAPLHGQPAPAGTIPLATLVPPARPPPWARKKGK
jgi:hypothetical protein